MRLISILIVLLTHGIFFKGDPPPHHTESGFRNPWMSAEDERNFLDFLRWQWDKRFVRQVIKPDRYNFPSIPPEYVNPPQSVYSGIITWVGHATFLVQVAGVNILTDPVWSNRVGPARLFGVRRQMPPGIPWENLPPIHAVVISHNHYDHMDKSTIERLERDFQPIFFVPLGNKNLLESWGIKNVIELDWWESYSFEELDIICTPSQHFSQRWINDRNETLWSSWVIRAPHVTFFFAGDTGYFPGFSEIAEKVGPVDVAMLPIGAYEPRWFMKPVHINPPEAVQILIDMNSRYLAAMHWGTFDQTDEPLDEPPTLLRSAADSLGVEQERIWIFAFGETRSVPPRPENN